jgi:hypothetical protein
MPQANLNSLRPCCAGQLIALKVAVVATATKTHAGGDTGVGRCMGAQFAATAAMAGAAVHAAAMPVLLCAVNISTLDGLSIITKTNAQAWCLGSLLCLS